MDRPTFVQQLEQGGLLNDLRLRLRLEEPGVQALDGRALARVLLRQGLLTAYQANQLLAGKARDLVIGPYLLLERLGEGGMGRVYKAMHRTLGRSVAIKAVARQLLNDPVAAARFQREIEAIGRLKHPNIVTAFDAFEADDGKYLVMEYVEGIDLGRLVKETGPLPIELACHCIYHAALGLQHAHERGLVHRDLKPSNLLLQGSRGPSSVSGLQKITYGDVKVLDLGLARFRGPSSDLGDPGELGEPDELEPRTITKMDQIMGTPDFMAPEQARDTHSADHLSDIYSLGSTLYYCLTGQPPFPDGEPLEKLLKHQYEEPVLLENLRPDVGPSLARLVRRMMAKDRSRRPASAAHVARALERWRRPPDVIAPAPQAKAVVPVALRATPAPASSPTEPPSSIHFTPAKARAFAPGTADPATPVSLWALIAAIAGVALLLAIAAWLS